jgi:prepilin-type processing-associated H-X9-DG protein/prepilin-type N-terminal cleavage/methylation domain-containing protein
MKNPSDRHHGFSLVEILVVILIILVLAAVLVPTIYRMRDRASASGCASNMRQCVVMANMFTAEQNGRLPRLHVYNAQMGSEFGKTPLPVNERIVNNASANFWPDLLTTYAEAGTIFSCPKLKISATSGSGGGKSNRIPLGIGINWPSMAPNNGEAQGGTGYSWTRLSAVPDPSRVVWFADAAGENSGPWKDRLDRPATGSCFFRGNTNNGQCVMPRHGGKINVGYVDGHVALVYPTEIDWGERDTTRSYLGYTKF